MNSYQQWQIVVKFNIPLFYRCFYNHLSNYTKTIIRLRLVNIGEYSLRLRRIIVKYIYAVIYIFSIITQVITDKLRYSVVERKNTDQNAKVMETITLKDGFKKYNATLICIGKLIVA